MLGVINGEELANDRGGVSVAAKELNGLYLPIKEDER